MYCRFSILGSSKTFNRFDSYLYMSNPPIDFFSPLLRHDFWPFVAAGLRWGLFGGMGWLLWRFSAQCRNEPRAPRRRRLLRGFRALLVLVGLLLLGRQASWQIWGRQRPEFVAFMQRYDRREFNPAHRVRAGRVLDRNGVSLAVSRVTDRGIRRVYPFGPMFAHAVGYNHPVYGLSGVESAARRYLLGYEPGSRADWIDLGKSLLDRETYAEGPPVYTTLHAGVQRVAHELMRRRRGAVVVIEVDTGALLALVSSPAFDPNRLGEWTFRGEDGMAPLLNRALAGRYPPGSVWKVLVAATALQAGFEGRLDTPPEGFTTSGANPPIRDHEYYTARDAGREWRGRGRIDLGEALVHSSNVFFAQLGARLDADSLRRAVRASGAWRDLYLMDASEPTLRVPPASGMELSDDRPYAKAQFAIGQGEVLVSPVHVATVLAGVANGGLCPAPRLELDAPVRPLGRLCSPAAAARLRTLLRRVVTEGTGRGILLPEISVAGKTGTAQTGGSSSSHSWFAGFAPAENPRWAFCVLVEHGGYGSEAALPVARELLKTAAREGWLRP